MSIFKLANPLKYYAWGSTDFIPKLLNTAPNPQKPVAEMWMGAHPTSSSRITTSEGDVFLNDYIQSAPDRILGLALETADSQLPFLLKVLSADKPLSIQAHPDREQARQGFARENAQSLPLDAPNRNYRDNLPKPELLCALTPFRAFCGFRSEAEIVGNFHALGLDTLFSSLSQPTPNLLQSLFKEILATPPERKAVILRMLQANLRQPKTGLAPEIEACCKTLAEYYPEDLGILAPLYLNLFELQPGEALYLGAGVPHSYISGSGLEIMSNSDNVLRGGLTPKYVDVDELVRIVNPVPYTEGVIHPRQFDDFLVFSAPVSEFELYHLKGDFLSGKTMPVQGMPGIVLCLQGEWRLTTDCELIELKQGESAFVTADTQEFTITGSGSIWLATVPRSQN